MRIVGFGASGMADCFGARLAGSGEGVKIVARAKHREATADQGIRLPSVSAQKVCASPLAVSSSMTILDA